MIVIDNKQSNCGDLGNMDCVGECEYHRPRPRPEIVGVLQDAPTSPPARIVKLEVDLDELHAAIAESVRIALAATGHRIVGRDGRDDTDGKIRELGRNAAAALMLFVAEDE